MRRAEGLIAAIARAVEAAPRRAYALLAAFVCVSAWFSVGWLQADECARVLEPAHALVYGFATLPWEFDPAKPLVSFWLGVLHAPPLALARALGASGLAAAAMLRAASGLACMTRIWAFALVAPLLGLSARRRMLYTVLFATTPFALMLLVRTSQENWATTALLWGLYFLLRTRGGAAKRWPFAAGAALALAVSFRMQAGPSCLALGVWAAAGLWRQRRAQALALLVGGAVVGLLPMALVDAWVNGAPFLPAQNYLAYALTNEDGAALWGRQPWTLYLSGFLANFSPPLSVALLPLAVAGVAASPPLAAIIVPFVAIHLGLAHKEIRYITPILPVVALAALLGWERFEARWPVFAARFYGRALNAYGALSLAFAVLVALVPLNPQPYFYDEVRRTQTAARTPYTFVANSRSSLSQFYLNDPALAPAATLTIAAFKAGLAATPPLRGDFALQRVALDGFPAIEAACHVVYVSIPGWHRRLLESLGDTVPYRYLDAIVRCG